MTADDIIKAVRDLPSLPAVVSELLATMDQDDIDTHALAAKITLDQALTAKTLRLANSSFYGMPTKVTTIQQAISVLGFHSIRTLVTACSVTGSFKPGPGSDFDFPAFWRHAIASAVCARVLAPHYRLNPDTAFTAGLLHDLGKLVLATRFPAEYAEVDNWRREHGGSVAEAQLQFFGVDDTQAGGALAAYWKFPPAIQDAISQHHRPAAAGLAQAVYLANLLAEPAEAADVNEAAREQAWAALAVNDEERQQITASCELVVNDMCRILVG